MKNLDPFSLVCRVPEGRVNPRQGFNTLKRGKVMIISNTQLHEGSSSHLPWTVHTPTRWKLRPWSIQAKSTRYINTVAVHYNLKHICLIVISLQLYSTHHTQTPVILIIILGDSKIQQIHRHNSLFKLLLKALNVTLHSEIVILYTLMSVFIIFMSILLDNFDSCYLSSCFVTMLEDSYL